MIIPKKTKKGKSDNADPSLHGVKIIFVFGSLELGGSEGQGLLLARELKDNHKAHVEIWGLRKEPEKLARRCEEYGIPWRAIPFTWPLPRYLFLTNLLELFKFAGRLRRCAPDLLLPYTYLPNTACGLVWRFTGARLCVWNQRDEGLCLTRNFWHRLAVRLTPCFIANSIAGRRFLSETYGIGPEKVEVITNGIVFAEPKIDRETWRKNLGLSSQTFIACMVANVHRYKDHRTLLKAWRLIIARDQEGGPEPIMLLAGRLDEGEQELRMLADALDLGLSVRFLGGVDDVAGLLRAVDLCVHSSRSEGLSNAVLEAMAAGLPVVGTDIPGIREAVGAEGWRFLSPPDDPEGMAERIKTFLHDKALRSQVGARLKKRVEEEFDPGTMCKRTILHIARHL